MLRTLSGAPAEAAPGPTLNVLLTEQNLRAISVPLAQGAVGRHVRLWQTFLGIRVDGIFGPVTAGATEAFRLSHGLGKGRAVDENTIAASIEELARRNGAESGLVPINAFVQARGFTRANRAADDVHWVVIHTMEAPEKGTTAEAVAEYFRTTTTPASAHFCIDIDSVVQCVRLEDVAWGAPGANGAGVQLEHAGYAKQSVVEWADDYSTKMLERSAAVAVQHVQPRFKIPTSFIDRDKLRQAKAILDAGKSLPDALRGITTHNEVSQAFHLSTHTDPGPSFPMDAYLTLMRKAATR